MKELIEELKSYSWPKDDETAPQEARGTIDQGIEELKNYKSWLSGDERVPQEVGEMIDEAIDALEKWNWAAPDTQAPNPLPDHVESKKFKEPE